MDENNNYLSRGKEKNDKMFLPNFHKKRELFCGSLFEVEKFLCDFQKFYKYVELYKILK